MNTENALAAKVIGNIIAEGMNLCDVNLSEEVHSEAVDVLDKIRRTIGDKEITNKKKLHQIEEIMRENKLF